ncbi:MAG: EF-P lysine aminoacylase EpmA [Planctomycetota bacterium]
MDADQEHGGWGGQWFGRLVADPVTSDLMLLHGVECFRLEVARGVGLPELGCWARVRGCREGSSLVAEAIEKVAPGDLSVLGRLGEGPERFLLAPGKMARLARRSGFLAEVRRFFDAQGFLEVETPCLVPAAGTDLAIEAFEVPFPSGSSWYLHTSPELAMKRLLATGLTKIYQVARVFRQGEVSALHNPEFTMAEWYRVGADDRVMMEDVEALVRVVLGERLRYAGRTLDLRLPLPRLSVQEAFIASVGVDLGECTTAERLAEELGARGYDVPRAGSYGDLFFRMIVERVEPWLAAYDAVFLTDYPAPVAALARLAPEDARFAERFELFVAGIEIANGYSELVDANEQEARFEAERAARRRLMLDVPPLPRAFIDSLRLGLPPCAGVSAGLDRLFMLREDVQDVAEVLGFPWPHPADRAPYRPEGSGPSRPEGSACGGDAP